MPTFLFRCVVTGEVRNATAVANDVAREVLAAAWPEQNIHDGELWVQWECWSGGRCLWHRLEDGTLTDGPRKIGEA